MNTLLKYLRHLIFPVYCPICKTPAHDVCPSCYAEVLSQTPFPRCLLCGNGAPCPKHGERWILYPATVYRRNARELLLSAKYARRGLLARRMGKTIADVLIEAHSPLCDPHSPEGECSLITIPCHRKKKTPFLKSHLEFFTEGILSRLPHLKTDGNLCWSRRIRPQKTADNLSERRQLPLDSFIYRGEEAPRNILLLDDVSTSGRTLYCAGRALYAAGAEKITFICWGDAS